MLTGPEIIRRRTIGDIVIEPFNPLQVGANSYDLTLSPNLLVYNEPELDMAKENPTSLITIPAEGYVLNPNELYLGLTCEIAGSRGLVPCINGRSSIARLGIFVHVTAGFGDDGFVNRWTLELAVIKPVRIYPYVRICQIYFEELQGGSNPYVGKYREETGIPVASRMFKEFPTIS
jgi:dCTP deaminase